MNGVTNEVVAVLPPELRACHAPELKTIFQRRRIPFLAVTVAAMAYAAISTMFMSLGTSHLLHTSLDIAIFSPSPETPTFHRLSSLQSSHRFPGASHCASTASNSVKYTSLVPR